MITEDYVSFETAKLLKKKGFHGQYHMYYVEDGKYICSDLHDIKDCAKSIAEFDYLHRTKIPAPTLQMTMKWLREVHKAFISITYENDGVFTANLKVPLKGIDCMIDNKHNCWLTYEEAAEVAIMYCLQNLI